MSNISVLMLTSEWPTEKHPNWAPFLVQQVAYLQKAGVDVDVYSFRGAKNLINYSKAWIRVRKKLAVKHYDLIHAQFGQSGIIALPKSIPLVVTFHGSDLQGDVKMGGGYTIQGKILQAVSRLVARFADEIILVSSHLKNEVGSGLTAHVIPCGLNLDLFLPIDQNIARQKLNLPFGKRLVMFGGRPEMPVKRYELAKKAVSQIEKKDFELVVVNNASHDQMPYYLNACDVLLLTSAHEGSPTIIKEALACNLPIVSTDVGDVRERIGNIVGCEVCADDRPKSLAAALVRVVSHGQRINGRETVLELNEEILTQKIILVYRKAIQGKMQL